jgi:integrase
VIAKYVDRRMEEGAQNATINRELAALKRMFRLGYYATPAKVFRLPAFPRLQEDNTRTGFLEHEQFHRLASATSELWLRTFLEAAYTYGWRKRELLNLRVRQVDLQARTIRLEVGTTKNRERPRGHHDRQPALAARRMRAPENPGCLCVHESRWQEGEGFSQGLAQGVHRCRLGTDALPAL